MEAVFHLGDILTVTTGELLSPRHLEGVDELLTHLIGVKPASDIDAVAAIGTARDALYRQMPWLQHVVMVDSRNPNDVITWFCHQVVERGAYHTVIGVEQVVDAEIVNETPAEEVAAGVVTE